MGIFYKIAFKALFYDFRNQIIDQILGITVEKNIVEKYLILESNKTKYYRDL